MEIIELCTRTGTKQGEHAGINIIDVRGAFKLSPAAFVSLLSSHLPEQLISKEDISRQDTAVAPLCAENRGVKM